MQIVIPCAGEGRRFREQGYTTIKQLLEVHGRTVLSYLVENFRQPDAEFTFLFQQKHLAEYRTQIDAVLAAENIKYRILEIATLTDGAVSTALIGCEGLPSDDELTYCKFGSMDCMGL